MPEVSACVCNPLVPEAVSFRDGALCYEWDTVVYLSSSLVDTMPMNSKFQSLHSVVDVDNYLVSFTNLIHRNFNEFCISYIRIKIALIKKNISKLEKKKK